MIRIYGTVRFKNLSIDSSICHGLTYPSRYSVSRNSMMWFHIADEKFCFVPSKWFRLIYVCSHMIKTQNVSSAGKACRTIEGGVYPGRLCFTCSGNKNSNEDSSCFIRVISSMCRLYPLWAETRAINISNFNERVLRSRLLAVPIESRYVSTGCTSQVV